jgi:AcrR family transcriptional regulator
MMWDVALRDDQRELTRRTILGAVLDLVAHGTLDELSVPAVSRQSGVSVATIYRYFPTKDDLLAAAAAEPSRRALDAASPRLPDDDDFAAFQRAMWTDFSHNLPLLRHQLTSEAGRAMREARVARSKGMLSDYIRSQGVEPNSAEGQRLISLVLLVSGSLGLVELHDRQALGIDEAIDVSLWATRVLVEASRTNSQIRTDKTNGSAQRSTKKRGTT